MTPAAFAEARKSLGLTQAQLAATMGLSAREILARWETGAHAIPPTAARLLQAYLDGYRPADWPT